MASGSPITCSPSGRNSSWNCSTNPSVVGTTRSTTSRHSSKKYHSCLPTHSSMAASTTMMHPKARRHTDRVVIHRARN